MHVFWQRGYEGTSIDTLEIETGIRRGSLYNTFGDKRGLFLAAMDHYLDGYVAERLATLSDGESPKRAISTFFEDVASFTLGEGRGSGCLVTNTLVELAARDREIGRKIETSFAAIENRFYDAVQAAQTAGEIPEAKNTRALARFLVNSLHGLRVMAKLDPDREQLRDVVAITVAALD
jgi:TetR/AcrR family transcriptional repressor of nem operon